MNKKTNHIFILLGSAAVLLYIVHVILGGLLWPDFSHLQQPISDLTASGAPYRQLLLLFTTMYGILILLFALWLTFVESKKHSKQFLWGGICFVFLHLISNVYSFFPEDLAGQPVTFRGTMHIILTVFIVPFTILSPLFFGLALIKEPAWKSFGVYAIITCTAILLFGATSGIFYAKKIPYFGLVERLNIGTLQLWTFIFSLKLFLQSRITG